MRTRTMTEFERALRMFCKEHQLLFEVKASGPGPHKRFVIFDRRGHEVTRIASLILRNDQKELTPAKARNILRGLDQRLAQELSREASGAVSDCVAALIDYIQRLFS